MARQGAKPRRGGNPHGDVSTGLSQKEKFTRHFLTNDPQRIDTLTNRAINFMQRSHAAGNPFYLQISHYATHVDIQTRAATYEKYAAKEKGKIHDVPAFAGMVADVDGGIGRVLDAVEALGIANNTYIILLADNGMSAFVPPAVNNLLDHPSTFEKRMWNYPLRAGKWTLYEGGMREPFIVAGPGVKRGAQSDVPVVGWDILPTIADLAGYAQPLPADLDGGSFRGLLSEGTGTVKRPTEGLVFHYWEVSAGPAQSAFRLGDFKLFKNWESGKVELYNLREDLGEMNDLTLKMPEKTKELEARLMDYFHAVDSEALRPRPRPARGASGRED